MQQIIICQNKCFVSNVRLRVLGLQEQDCQIDRKDVFTDNIKYDLTQNKLAETTKERRLRCPSSSKERARVGPEWTWTWTWSGLGWSGRLDEVDAD